MASSTRQRSTASTENTGGDDNPRTYKQKRNTTKRRKKQPLLQVPSHVITEWTRTNIILFVIGVIFLAVVNFAPLVMLEEASIIVTEHPVSLESLLENSLHVRKSWTRRLGGGSRLHRRRQPDAPVPAPKAAALGPPIPVVQNFTWAPPRRGHIKCDVDVDDLVYWNDPQSTADQNFQSPFAPNDGIERFLSFEPDLGGWNNMRMSLEILLVFAAVSGRTLVLPPKSPMNLLGHGQTYARSFADFFPLDHPELQKHVKIITMKEFIEQHGRRLMRSAVFSPERLMAKVRPAIETCDHDSQSDSACNRLYVHLRQHGYQPKIHAVDNCFIFDETYFKFATTRSMTAPGTNVRRFCENRTALAYAPSLTKVEWIHWQASDAKYQLLNHFYTFFFFTDPVVGNFYKRLVRDFLHYSDSIYCAAGKIVHALQQQRPQDGSDVEPSFSTLHVRRADFRNHQVTLSAEEWVETTKQIFRPGEVLYIATDEHNKTFFTPLVEYGYEVRFLDDYYQIFGLSKLDRTYMGMIDSIVASHGRSFVGTWLSTFSGYIIRMRGYLGHEMKNTWYSFLPQQRAMHKPLYPKFELLQAREWPLGWNGIDENGTIDIRLPQLSRMHAAAEKSMHEREPGGPIRENVQATNEESKWVPPKQDPSANVKAETKEMSPKQEEIRKPPIEKPEELKGTSPEQMRTTASNAKPVTPKQVQAPIGTLPKATEAPKRVTATTADSITTTSLKPIQSVANASKQPAETRKTTPPQQGQTSTSVPKGAAANQPPTSPAGVVPKAREQGPPQVKTTSSPKKPTSQVTTTTTDSITATPPKQGQTSTSAPKSAAAKQPPTSPAGVVPKAREQGPPEVKTTSSPKKPTSQVTTTTTDSITATPPKQGQTSTSAPKSAAAKQPPTLPAGVVSKAREHGPPELKTTSSPNKLASLAGSKKSTPTKVAATPAPLKGASAKQEQRSAIKLKESPAAVVKGGVSKDASAKVELKAITKDMQKVAPIHKEELKEKTKQKTKPSFTVSDLIGSNLSDALLVRDLPLARGIAGRPVPQTPALIGAHRGHIDCEVNVDSLAYWNDPQGERDINFKSPYAVKGDQPKYLTFIPDAGGWNNIRMGMETIFVFAVATGRTLVLPPEEALYLLTSDKKDRYRGFGDFFPLHTAELQKRVPIISTEEFVKREGGPGGRLPLPEANKTQILNAVKHCEYRAKSPESCFPLWDYLERVGRVPQIGSNYAPGKPSAYHCVIFDEDVYHGGKLKPELKDPVTKFCGTRNLTYWTNDMEDPVLLHFKTKDGATRLLVHFYAFMLFTNPVHDNYFKRFVRDFLHYNDRIYCAAGKIVKALQIEAHNKGFPRDKLGNGGFSSLHIRRGDFQYKEVKLSAEEWYNNTKELWQPNEILYIATDERNKTFFDPLAEHHELRFLDDYWSMSNLSSLDPNFMGMIDTIVASRGRVFVGTWFSTFSGYINRMRGYHGLSMKDSWYSWLPRKAAVHKWGDEDGKKYSYEWPAAWCGVDGDVWPPKDVF